MDPPERVSLPANFEEVDVNVLVELIGAFTASLSNFSRLDDEYFLDFLAADMMERLMAHNDRIPLSPCARTMSSKSQEAALLTR